MRMWLMVSLFGGGFIIPPTLSQSKGGKLFCLDNKGDVTSSLWTGAGALISAATSVSQLPKGFGDLKGLGANNDLWYMEGPTTTPSSAKDIFFRSPLNLYTSIARSVTIYIKYYTNSQRRISLYPVKEGGGGGSSPALGSLQLLPLRAASSSIGWNEVRKDIDPSNYPIEITAHLSSKEFLLFDKIVVAVDTPLPSDLGISCSVMKSPPTGGTSPPAAPWTTTTPIATSRSSLSTPVITPQQQCPPIPPVPECKCNCLCNCSKC